MKNSLTCTARPMMRVVDSLVALGYIENHKGFLDRSRGIGFQSRMRATPKLIDLIQRHEVTPAMIEREDDDVIVLRDEDKTAIPFKDNEEIK